MLRLEVFEELRVLVGLGLVSFCCLANDVEGFSDTGLFGVGLCELVVNVGVVRSEFLKGDLKVPVFLLVPFCDGSAWLS